MKRSVSSLIEQVKDAVQAWQQVLQDQPQPTEAEARLAEKELLFLVLREVYSDYMEAAEGDRQAEKADLRLVEQTLSYLRGQLAAQKSTGEQPFYAVALRATQLLQALRESSTYPHPYVTLSDAPSLLFPLKNAETGEQIWIELSPTQYGFSVNAHRRKPRTRDVATPSRETAMSGIHVDYYIVPRSSENPLTQKGTPRQRWKRPQELLQIQLFDETVGPYDEPHWLIPDDYSASEPESSILLVRDVRRWKAPEEDPAEANGETQQEAHAADVLNHPAEKGDHHA